MRYSEVEISNILDQVLNDPDPGRLLSMADIDLLILHIDREYTDIELKIASTNKAKIPVIARNKLELQINRNLQLIYYVRAQVAKSRLEDIELKESLKRLRDRDKLLNKLSNDRSRGR